MRTRWSAGCGWGRSRRRVRGHLLAVAEPTENAQVLRKRNTKRLAVSGWAIDSGYKARLGVDEAFPFSDHADFNDLMSFVKACEPEMVITHHGFADSLAYEIKARLGIEARPLLKGQRSLLEF